MPSFPDVGHTNAVAKVVRFQTKSFGQILARQRLSDAPHILATLGPSEPFCGLPCLIRCLGSGGLALGGPLCRVRRYALQTRDLIGLHVAECRPEASVCLGVFEL